MTGDRVLTRSERVSASIATAVTELLAERDLKDLTMDVVAERAGVGKAALYRRYPSKEVMAVDIFCVAAERFDPRFDSGDLRTDLGVFLRSTLRLLDGSIARRLVPELFAAAHRDPGIAAMIRERLLKTRRASALEMLRRGVKRGELDPDADADFLLDLLAGGFYWRIFVRGDEIRDRDIDAFVDALMELGRPGAPMGVQPAPTRSLA